MKIVSPVPTGSGAMIVHQILAEHIQGYRISPFHPLWTLVPPLMMSMRNRQAELVHTVADYAFFVSPPTVPLIITFHNFVLDDFMRSYSSKMQWLHYKTDLKLFIRMALQRADAVTAVSQATADLVTSETGYGGDISVIPNGVDLARFSPPSERTQIGKEIRVLFSGNPSSRKGAQWLSAIAARLSPGIKIICTSGLSNHKNMETTERLEVVGSIPYDEMPDQYRSVDILLMPSVREGLSLSILEAMASGLPVVTTNCSSMPEQIEHDKGGYLCRLGDVDDFAHRINMLAASERMRKEMGEFNRSVAEERFSLDRMIELYRALFDIFCRD